MKQSTQSQLIHIWEDYEFYLNIPKSFAGSNKPFIYFYYLDIKASKQQRIRKYVGKNDGNMKLIKEEAKKLNRAIESILIYPNGCQSLNMAYFYFYFKSLISSRSTAQAFGHKGEC